MSWSIACSIDRSLMIDRKRQSWEYMWYPDMGTTFLFDWTQSQKVDPTQLTTHNCFTRLDSSQLTTQNGFLKLDSNRLTTQKPSRILIQINTWLKNSPESWFESTHDSMMLLIPSFVWPFWAFNFTVDSVWPFWAFFSSIDFVWPSLGFPLKCLPRQTDLNQLMTQAISQRLESIQLMTQAGFQELTQNQLMSQMDFQILIQIDSWHKMLSDFSIQISSWLKRKTFDSESTPDSTLSHTHVWWDLRLVKGAPHGCLRDALQ